MLNYELNANYFAKIRCYNYLCNHDQVEAMTMGDRVAIINDGKLVQIDKPSNLYNKPINTFVASFIGSPKNKFF